MSELLQKGIQYAQQATERDRAEDYEAAYTLYKRALDYFINGLRYEKNQRKREIIEARAQEYMKRAEELKKYLDERQAAPQVQQQAGTGATKNKPSGGGKGEEDKEEAALSAAIAEAIVREKPNVHWSDVAGQETAKKALNEAVRMPILYPHLFVGNRKPWKGILLYGPPGTGKSYLAKAVATEFDATFFSISASRLMSKWQGESERLVRELFEMARRERPTIIFVDEVDSLCSARGDNESESARRVKTEFLVQMDGVGADQQGVLVLGATNLPWALDQAIRRRFERRIYISLPDFEARKAMFGIHLGKTPHTLTEQHMADYAQRTDGFSSDDIKNIVRAAMYLPISQLEQSQFFRQAEQDGKTVWLPCGASDSGAVRMTISDIRPEELGVPPVTPQNFEEVLRTAKPSVGKEDLVKQEEFTREFGME